MSSPSFVVFVYTGLQSLEISLHTPEQQWWRTNLTNPLFTNESLLRLVVRWPILICFFLESKIQTLQTAFCRFIARAASHHLRFHLHMDFIICILSICTFISVPPFIIDQPNRPYFMLTSFKDFLSHFPTSKKLNTYFVAGRPFY